MRAVGKELMPHPQTTPVITTNAALHASLFYVPQYAKFVWRTSVVVLDVVMYNVGGMREAGKHAGGGRETTMQFHVA